MGTTDTAGLAIHRRPLSATAGLGPRVGEVARMDRDPPLGLGSTLARDDLHHGARAVVVALPDVPLDLAPDDELERCISASAASHAQSRAGCRRARPGPA
jgi:hypothetical protein